MHFKWHGDVEVRDEETGEVVGRKPMCVEADDNVPFGCELGGPRPREIRKEWPIILLLLAVPTLIVFIIILGIISAVSRH